MPQRSETLPSSRRRTASAPATDRVLQFKRFGIAAALLTAVFGYPLFELFRFASGSELYSHIPLIPIVSAYFVWLQRKSLPFPSAARPWLAVLPLVAGIAAGLSLLLSSYDLSSVDGLALATAAYLLLLVGAAGLFLGPALLRALAFPLGFLVFMVPLPSIALEGVNTILQHGSAEAAYGLFTLAGMTVFREGMLFQLPTITLMVAPECSGIHSTLALFITSFVAGKIFLRSPWLRALLAFAVLPLALLRNGFRVFTLGELCVHVGPDMIDSYIHHQGGPIFFALSLIPFAGLLFLLVRSERRRTNSSTNQPLPR